MRKITSLLSLLLLTMVSLNVSAQNIEDYGTPLITDASQFYDNQYGDEGEGTDLSLLIDYDNSTFWHTDWRGREHPDGEHHWLFVKFNEPVSGKLVVWMVRRGTTNDHPTKMLVEGSNDPAESNNDKVWTPITEISFPFDGQGTQTQSPSFDVETPYTYLRFAASDCMPADPGFRKYWHTAEFQLYQIEDEMAELRAQLDACLLNYDAYCRLSQGDRVERLNMGEDFGQYSDLEAEAAFLDALDEVFLILDGQKEMPTTKEEIQAIVDGVNENYNKVIASENLFKLNKDGYYRVIGGMPYYSDVETGEVDDAGEPIKERRYHNIAMYGDVDGYGYWKAYDPTDCRQVWKLEQKEGGIKMVNAASDMQFSTFGSPVTMSLEADTLVVFDFAGKENGHDIIYIRMSGAARGSGNYLHQWNHSRGAGSSSKMCSWNPTFTYGEPYESDKGTSEWYLEEVSDEEAEALIKAYEPIKNHDVLVLQYEELIAKSQNALAISKEEASSPTVSDNSQFSSWCTESSEGNINNLLDGDPGTFWHSTWTGGNVDNHTHGIDVKYDEPVSGTFKVWVARRGTNENDDNVTLFSVYGSNDESLLESGSEEGWTQIGVQTLPWSSSVKSQYAEETFTIDEATPYQYLRFYNDQTRGPNSGNNDRGYFHMGDFNVYQITGKQQLASMGEVGDRLIAAIATAEATDRATMQYDDLLALQAAYDAFTAVLVDPTELRNAISNNRTVTIDYAEGEDPGCYATPDTKDALEALLAEAQAYNELGAYTKEKNAEYVEKINAAVEAYRKGRNPISTDKWYLFRHMTEEQSQQYNISTNSILYGQIVAAGYQDEEGKAVSYDPEAIRTGSQMYFFNEDNVSDMDAAMFRFVAISDSTYAIQNKANGLYICRQAQNDIVTLDLTPSQFHVESIGYGQNLIVMTAIDGTTFSAPNLNAWANENGSLLQWWNDTSAGCNSTFMIEIAEDVNPDDIANTFKKDIKPGKIYSMCYPVSITDVENEGEMYAVAGTYTQDGKNYVGLKAIETSEPGVPFVYIYGDIDNFNPEAETADITFQKGDVIVNDPSRDGAYKGTYVYEWVDKGLVAFVDNKAVVTDGEENTDCTRDISPNTGYIEFGKTTVDPASVDFYVEIEGTIEDGIQSAIANVAKAGNVYNTAGQLVRSNATLKSLKGLEKGVYILNGTKVLVK